MQECRNLEVQECKGVEVQECRGVEVVECRGAEVQEQHQFVVLGGAGGVLPPPPAGRHGPGVVEVQGGGSVGCGCCGYGIDGLDPNITRF